jgi:hypothetical protein
MNDALSTKSVIISCSALKQEVESLCKEHWPRHRLLFLPSMLHMHPERLAASLESALEAEMIRSRDVVLIYGDCCARMTALEALPVVTRTRGKNCCELLLGDGEYRRLSHEGAFFLIPEWAGRWKEVFSRELGLNRENAAGLMGDMCKKLVYLDTGLVPTPDSELRDCAEYLALPCEVMPVSLKPLQAAIEEAVLRCITKVFLRETRLNS